MPFGFPGYGAGSAQPDPLESLITEFFAGARSRVEAQDFGSIFNDLLSTSAPRPTDRPVASPVSPFGSMASTFAATLADQLGARGASAQNADRLAQHEAGRQATMEANRADQLRYESEKYGNQLRIRMAINEAKMEQAKQLNNLDEYEARLKAAGALRKEQIRLQEEAKMRTMAQMNKDIFDRVTTVARIQGANRIEAIKYSKVLKEAMQSPKMPDEVKIWARAQTQEIFAKDEIGSFVHDEAERERMQADLYEEMLTKAAKLRHPETTGGTGGGGLFDF